MTSFEEHFSETVIPAIIDRDSLNDAAKTKAMAVAKLVYEAVHNPPNEPRPRGPGRPSIYSDFNDLADSEGFPIKRQGHNMAFNTLLVRYVVDTAKMDRPNLRGWGRTDYPSKKAWDELVRTFEPLSDASGRKRRRERDAAGGGAPKKHQHHSSHVEPPPLALLPPLPSADHSLSVPAPAAPSPPSLPQTGPLHPHGSLQTASFPWPPAFQRAEPQSTAFLLPASSDSMATLPFGSAAPMQVKSLPPQATPTPDGSSVRSFDSSDTFDHFATFDGFDGFDDFDPSAAEAATADNNTAAYGKAPVGYRSDIDELLLFCWSDDLPVFD